MREITDIIESTFEESPSSGCMWHDGVEYVVPVGIMRALHKGLRLFQFDDVNDVRTHYSQVSQLDPVPPPYLAWFSTTTNTPLTNIAERGFMRYCALDNVRVENVRHSREPTFAYCEFTIVDQHEERIDAVAVYDHTPSFSLDGDIRGDIALAECAASDSRFDILFYAANESIPFGSYGFVGERLIIQHIKKRPGGDSVLSGVPATPEFAAY